MEAKPLSEFTDAELAIEAKKRKTHYYTACVMVGFMFGIAVYSTVRNGFGILTVLPIIFLPMGRPATKNYKEVKAEIAARESESKV